MSKAVRWQIDFVSRKGTRYRINIYDEQSDEWSGITTLLAGETPFQTEEDNNNDFFAPIRSQTGNIEVCTSIPAQTNYPDGGQLNLDNILPANNLARPIRLINRDNSDEVEWQGFLSCEMYTQAYTSIPENIQLSVISTLEAMDSVEVDLSESMSFKKVLGHIAYAMKSIETKSGMSLFRNVYLSQYVRHILTDKWLYNNSYFKSEEQISGDNIVVEVHSISCKEILAQIAKFFGCCWRENGKDIYLEAIGKTNAFDWETFANIASDYINGTSLISLWNTLSQSVDAMSSLQWAGTNHVRNMAQGMRRIKIAAKLDGFDCNMALEECPLNSLVVNPSGRQSTNGEVHVNTNETFYSLAEHKHYLTKVIFPLDLSAASLQLISTLSAINYAHTIFWETNDFRQYYEELVVSQSLGSNGIDHYITSFMAWWRDRQNQLQSGLMICGVPKNLYFSTQPVQGRTWSKYSLTSSNYLFRQRTPLVFAATKGYLKIDINTLAWSNAPGTMPSIVYGQNVDPSLTIAIQFGNKWAYKDGNTYKWSSSFQTIAFPLEHKTTNDILKTLGNWSDTMGVNESDGIFIGIPSFMSGFVSVYIYPYVDALCADPYVNGMFDVFITKLDVEYVVPSVELRTDRSENVYATDTSELFKEDLDVNCDFASYANNTKLATMLWHSETSPVKLLWLGGADKRPEVDLLSRLKTYYSVARQRLELEAEHIETNALAAIRLQGLGDGKVYLPLSESRDWQTGVCKLTCFEMPQ